MQVEMEEYVEVEVEEEQEVEVGHLSEVVSLQRWG